MATSTPQSSTIYSPSKQPLPLSAAQEAQVRDLYYKRVRNYCADEIRDFASCALNRTISATWACRTQRLAMNNCMISHSGRAEEDAAREEWFATIDKRKQLWIEKEAKKKEQEKFHREWWGLPPLPDEGRQAEVKDDRR